MRKTLLLIACFIISFANLSAEGAISKSDLARRVGGTNEGTEFYITFHPASLKLAYNAKIRIFLAARATDAVVKLEITSLHVTRTIKVLKQTVSEIDLDPTEAMLYTLPGQTLIEPFSADNWKGSAVHLVSDNPFLCFANFDGDAGSEGYMAIPVKNWGKEYTVSNYPDLYGSTQSSLPSFTSIIASSDNTNIEFTIGGNPTVAIPLPNDPDLKAGMTYKKTINRGDVLLIPGKNLHNDLSGSKVKADKPIAVFSGNFNAYIPGDVTPPNYTIEMEHPEFCWGNEYITPTVKNRLKNPFVRIYSKDTPNNLYKDGIKFWTFISQSPFLDSSWTELRTDLGDPRSVDFSSDSVINLVLYNPGYTEDSVVTAPFQMNLLPMNQYQNNYSFIIPNTAKATPYSSTYLALIYQTSDTTKIPDDLQLSWDDGIGYIWRNINVLKRDKPKLVKQDTSGLFWMSANVDLPGFSFYNIKSSLNRNFAAYCYGFSGTKSFGYPAAGLYALPGDLDTLPPNISFSMDSISDDVNILVQDTSQTILDLSGICLFYLDQEHSYNVGMEILTGDSGKTLIKAKLRFIDHSLDARAHIVAADCNGNSKDTIINFTNLRQYPEFSPQKYDLGLFKLRTGNYKIDSITVINPSSTRNSIQIDSIVPINHNAQFIFYTDFLESRKLLPGENVKIGVTVKTDNPGMFTDTLIIYSLGLPVSFAYISAEVTEAQIDVTNDVEFHNVTIDSMSDPKRFAVRNIGSLPLVLQGVGYPGNKTFYADYIDFSNGKTYTINPGDSIEYSVRFKPLKEGLSLDSLTFFSDGAGSNIVHFKGNGIKTGVQELVEQGKILIFESGNEISFKTNEQIFTKSIEIYDYRGIKIYNNSINNYLNNTIVNTNYYPSGYYLMRITTEKGMIEKSFIKVR